MNDSQSSDNFTSVCCFEGLEISPIFLLQIWFISMVPLTPCFSCHESAYHKENRYILPILFGIRRTGYLCNPPFWWICCSRACCWMACSVQTTHVGISLPPTHTYFGERSMTSMQCPTFRWGWEYTSPPIYTAPYTLRVFSYHFG